MGVVDILRATARQLGKADRAQMNTFFGPSAKTFDYGRLATFLKAEMDGADRDAIWMNTMTGRKRSGDLFQEASDQGVRTNFADVLRHASPRANAWSNVGELIGASRPAILDAHPEFAKIGVRIEPNVDGSLGRIPLTREPKPESDHWAYLTAPWAAHPTLDPMSDVGITMSRSAANDISGMPTLIHELGHGASLASGHSSGTSIRDIRPKHDIAMRTIYDINHLKRARKLLDSGAASDWDAGFDAYMLNTETKDRLQKWMIDNGEPDARELQILGKLADENPWAVLPEKKYLSNEDETYQRMSAESVDASDVQRAILPPWERMKMLEWGPQNEEDLWALRMRPSHQRQTIEARARRNDEIGRQLADLIRAGAGIGGVAAALKIASDSTRKTGRPDHQRDRVTA